MIMVRKMRRVRRVRKVRATPEEQTLVLNVDLEVFSKAPLDALVSALKRKVDVLYVGDWHPRRYAACLEVAGSGYKADSERLIRRFVKMIKALPRKEKRLWDGALSREFNIGIETAAKARSFELRIDDELLDAVRSVNGIIIVTVYAPVRLPR
jgi:hypothetical protein